MKKIGLLLPALMWLAFFPSCKEEIEPVVPEDDTVPEGCYFRAYPETPEGESRTYLDGLNVIWRVGEELKVMNCATGDGTSGTIRNFESMDNARKALFYYDGTDFEMTPPYFAIYPSTKNVRRKTPGPIFEYTVPAAQTASVNSFSDSTNVAIGYANAEKQLKMYNLNSYVSFEINKTDLVNKAVLSCETGYLAGFVKQVMANQDFSADGAWGSKTITNGRPSITLTLPNNAYFSAGTYYIALIPGSFSGLTLELKNGDKLVSCKTRTGAFSATRNNIYELGNITPSDVATAFGRASTVKNVSNITKRTLAEGLDYYYVKTTSRTSNEGDSETWDDVNFHILEIQFSASPAFDMRCVLAHNAPTPWDNKNWDIQSLITDHWVHEVNDGDEHVLAMFPCSDYRDSTSAGNNVPYGRVHSRARVLHHTSEGTNQGEVTVRRVGSVVRGLSFSPADSYYNVNWYHELASINYTDLGGYYDRIIQNEAINTPITNWNVTENSSGPHAAIGYVGDNTNATGSYKKAYYVLSEGGFPYNLADLMKELGCYNAAMQHPGAIGELILENSGKNGYEVKGSGSEADKKAMTAWALVRNQTRSAAWIAGSSNASYVGLKDGIGVPSATNPNGAYLQRTHGICWSGTENVAYFTQRATGTQAVRKINVSTREVTTLVYNNKTEGITNNEINGPYGCCAYSLGGKDGVLVANRNGGRPWKLFFVPDEADSVIEPINDTGLVSGITDVKVSPGDNVWLASTTGFIYKGSIVASVGEGFKYQYSVETIFDVRTLDDGKGKYPCSLAFDSAGNTLYGTWYYEDGTYKDSYPGIYLIPSRATDTSGIERIAGGSVQFGSDLGTPGDMLTASFPIVSGLYCGSDDGLYIAGGFYWNGTSGTNSLRKLIPVKKWDAATSKYVLTAESYRKGRMIEIRAGAALAGAGVIVNDDCTKVYSTDYSHRILEVQIDK